MQNLGQELTTHVKHKIPLIYRLYNFVNCVLFFPQKKKEARKSQHFFMWV
jgi:hypothetical protein